MTFQHAIKSLGTYLEQSVSIAPLVTFRIGFGLVMLFSTLRYIYMGWVESQLIEPLVHFHYYGFEWVRPLPGDWLYLVFGLMTLSTIAIALGWYYRVSAVLFFLCFSYIELLDISYYLNHYYFVSIVAFLIILVPANRYFSLDVLRNPAIRSERVHLWCIAIFKLQISIVYCYAGLAKLNADWLFRALPLAIWLPAKTSLPLIGYIFKYKATAYLFSWAGMLFDTFIVGFLAWKKTRWFAYVAVVIFHTLTGLLFQIGVFPVVMIFAVSLFFSENFHEKLLKKLAATWNKGTTLFNNSSIPTLQTGKVTYYLLIPFFLFQLLFPWRYLLYEGNLFWTEEGYRFSWRVMLMEKAGTATFYVQDGEGGREGAVINSRFLNKHQEKQMSMQPDMILQFAHYLKNYYMQEGMQHPRVRAEVFVTLNARPSKMFIDPSFDLAQCRDGWKKKDWILPFSEN